MDEEGVDEVGGGDDIFTDHSADSGRFTVTTWASSLSFVVGSGVYQI